MDTPEEQPSPERDGTYVPCPACEGKGGACEYCDGYGDVHPGDLRAIRRAVQDDRRGRWQKFAIMAACLAIGLGVAGLQLLKAPDANAVDESVYEKMPVDEVIAQLKQWMQLDTPDGYKHVVRVGRKLMGRATTVDDQRAITRLVDDAQEKISLRH